MNSPPTKGHYCHASKLLHQCLDSTSSIPTSISDIQRDLGQVRRLTTTRNNRQDLLRAQGLKLLIPFFQRSIKNPETLTCLELIASICINFSCDQEGRLAMSTCVGWNCLSYRHECPMHWFLNQSRFGASENLRRLCMGTLVNCTIAFEGKTQLEALGGINTCLYHLDESPDERLLVYTAACLWNCMKSPAIVLQLETRYSMLKEMMDIRLTSIIESHVRTFALVITQEQVVESSAVSRTRGSMGICDPTSRDNVNHSLAMSVSATSRGQSHMVLRMEVHVDKRFRRDLARGPMVELDKRPKSSRDIRVDAQGQVLPNVCPVCGRLCRLKSNRHEILSCHARDCTTCYHVPCSRWQVHPSRDIDDAEAFESTSDFSDEKEEEQDKESIFYCDKCKDTNVVQWRDFQMECPTWTTLFPTSVGRLDRHWNRIRLRRRAKDDDDHHHRKLVINNNKPRFVVLVDDQALVAGIGEIQFHLESAMLSNVRKSPNLSSSVHQSQSPSQQVIVKCVYAFKSFIHPWQQPVPTVPDFSLRLSPPWEEGHSRSYQQGFSERGTLVPGQAYVWKARRCHDLDPALSANVSLAMLERAYLYEFDQSPEDGGGQVYCFGAPPFEGERKIGKGSRDDAIIWSGGVFPQRVRCVKSLNDALREQRKHALRMKPPKKKKNKKKKNKGAKNKDGKHPNQEILEVEALDHIIKVSN